jgi:plasmid stabilization system protein ParE
MSEPGPNRVFHPAARLDYVQASEYYRAIDPKLNYRFLDEFEQAIEEILEFPELYPVVHPVGARRKPLRKFPYCIIYLEEPDALFIVAVGHQRQDPLYWVSRLNEPGRP